MYLTQPLSIKLASKAFQGPGVKSLEVNNQDNAVEEANEIYREWHERSKQDGNAAAEKLILGEYDEEMEELRKRFNDNPELRRAYLDKVGTEIDNELTKDHDADTRKALNSAKVILSKPSIPDYPIPANINFKGRYVDVAKNNASGRSDLSRLRTEGERVSFNRKLRGSQWSSESSFDNSVVNGLKESSIKRERALNLIKSKTNMSDSKLNSKLDVYESDLENLYENAKELESLNEKISDKKIKARLLLAAGFGSALLGTLAAASGIGLPFAAAAIGGGAAGWGYDNAMDDAKQEKREGLNNFKSQELRAHLLNIKLKKLMIKGKVSARDVSNIIY